MHRSYRITPRDVAKILCSLADMIQEKYATDPPASKQVAAEIAEALRKTAEDIR